MICYNNRIYIGYIMASKTLHSYELTLEEAKDLIKNGADVNGRNTEGYTPIFYQFDEEIIQLFIDHGADIEAQDNRGRTTLFTFGASHARHLLLIKNGANINKRDSNSHSILHFASNRPMIEFLIKNGAIASDINRYHHLKAFFSIEQQKAFDTFASITSNDDDFFNMCLSYQNDQKNNVKIEIKDMDIL